MRLTATALARLADLEDQPIGARVECPMLGGTFRRFRLAAEGDRHTADWLREDGDSRPAAITSTMLVTAGFIALAPHQTPLF